jgi:hypothetical protein
MESQTIRGRRSATLRAVDRRINRLEERFIPRAGQQMVLVIHDAGRRLALDNRVCLQLLRDAGHLDQESTMCCVDFGGIPAGLDAMELKRHLLENGHEVVLSSRRRA